MSVTRRWAQLRSAPAGPVAVPWWVHVLWLGLLLLTDGLQVWVTINAKSPLLPWPQVLLKLAFSDALASLLFYFNWVVLIPRTLSQGRAGQFLLGILGVLLLFTPLRLLLSWLLPGLTEGKSMNEHPAVYAVNCLFSGLATLVVSSGLKITGDYLVGQRNRRELERQQLLTELAMLKMQVNPHFLFNTLNNIYSLASQKSDRAPEAILRLADLMRYLLHDSAADTVLLAQELQHLRNFLELQRLRLPSTGPAALLLDTDGLNPEQAPPIAPMLLLPLVENAFKHGDLTARPAVSIQLSQEDDGSLHFVVDNAVDPMAGPALEQPGGVGLGNLRRRLQLLYPGRHRLHIEATPTQHHAALTLLPAAPVQ